MLTSRLGGRLLIAAAPVLLAAELVRSDHSQADYAAQLTDVANARTPELLAAALFLLGGLLLVPAAIGLASAASGRGSRLITLGSVLFGVSAIWMSAGRAMFALMLYTLTQPGFARDTAVRAPHADRKRLRLRDLPAPAPRAAPRPDRPRARSLARPARTVVARRRLADRNRRIPHPREELARRRRHLQRHDDRDRRHRSGGEPDHAQLEPAVDVIVTRSRRGRPIPRHLRTARPMRGAQSRRRRSGSFVPSSSRSAAPTATGRNDPGAASPRVRLPHLGLHQSARLHGDRSRRADRARHDRREWRSGLAVGKTQRQGVAATRACVPGRFDQMTRSGHAVLTRPRSPWPSDDHDGGTPDGRDGSNP